MEKKGKKKKKGGRPSKLTPELQAEIVFLIKAGNFIETTCDVVGINKSTFYAWMKLGDASTRPDKYTKFRDAVVNAQAFSEARDVAIIAKASEDDWRASAWKLERKFPDRWGKRKRK